MLDLWEEGDEFEEFEFTDFVLEANWFIKLRLLERQFAEKVQGLAKKAEKSALREFLNNVIKVKEAKISAADLERYLKQSTGQLWLEQIKTTKEALEQVVNSAQKILKETSQNDSQLKKKRANPTEKRQQLFMQSFLEKNKNIKPTQEDQDDFQEDLYKEGVSEEEDEDEAEFMPRHIKNAFRDPNVEQQKLRETQNGLKFTKMTRPDKLEKMQAMTSEQYYFGVGANLLPSDGILTADTLNAAIINLDDPNVPLSEFRKRELWYEAQNWFHEVIEGQQGELKRAVERKMNFLKSVHGLDKFSNNRGNKKFSFTHKDYRAICAVSYFVSRALLRATAYIMKMNNQKIMKERHLAAAACLLKIIPHSQVEFLMSDSEWAIYKKTFGEITQMSEDQEEADRRREEEKRERI